MGFRDLRVINEDWISANQGFGTHPHRDMEIITYIVEGELSHRDSTGREAIDQARRRAADVGGHGSRPQRVQQLGRAGTSAANLDTAGS